MAEYIKKEAALKLLEVEERYGYKCCSDFGFVLDPLHGGVICDTFVSAADVAPVVRCAKCDFRAKSGICAKSGLYMKDDGFCSYGKDGERYASEVRGQYGGRDKACPETLSVLWWYEAESRQKEQDSGVDRD